jgi:hypothetical protein
MVGLSSPPDPDELKAAGTISDVRYVTVDAHGNVLDRPSDMDKYLAENPTHARAAHLPIFETVIGDEPGPFAAAATSQAARPEEVEIPKRTGPTPTFRLSDDEVKRLLGAWFSVVDGSSLDNDDARHRYVAAWTTEAGWPKNKQTDSLRTAFARMRTDEAAAFISEVRNVIADERRELLDAADAPRDDGRDAPLPAAEEPF